MQIAGNVDDRHLTAFFYQAPRIDVDGLISKRQRTVAADKTTCWLYTIELGLRPTPMVAAS